MILVIVYDRAALNIDFLNFDFVWIPGRASADLIFQIH